MLKEIDAFVDKHAFPIVFSFGNFLVALYSLYSLNFAGFFLFVTLGLVVFGIGEGIMRLWTRACKAVPFLARI